MYYPNSKPSVSMGRGFAVENDYGDFSVRNDYEFNSKSSCRLLVIY